MKMRMGMTWSFQHTAARRRLVGLRREVDFRDVSTHSRPKAAGNARKRGYLSSRVSTHSRPKAAGKRRH